MTIGSTARKTLLTGALLLTAYACNDATQVGPSDGHGGSAGSGGEGAEGGGGAGGGTPMVCKPGESEACYSGPASTEGRGVCHAGARVCSDDGTAFGPCIGETLPSTESCASGNDDNCDGFTCGLWVKLFGDQATKVWVEGIAVDPLGEVAIAGNFAGSIAFGDDILESPSYTGFVAKLDALGKPMWARQIEANVTAVAMDTTGAVFLGADSEDESYFQGFWIAEESRFVAKLTPYGGVAWLQNFLGESGRVEAIAATADDVFVAGTFIGTLYLGGQALHGDSISSVGFIGKVRNANGKPGPNPWGAMLGSFGIRFTSVLPDLAGNVFFLGTSAADLTVGDETHSAHVFLAKFTDAGAPLALTGSDYVNSPNPSAVALDEDGAPLIVGSFSHGATLGGEDLNAGNAPRTFLWKLDPSGDSDWARAVGKDADGESVVRTTDGHFVVAGSFAETLTFLGPFMTSSSRDYYVAKITKDGNGVWQKPLPNIGSTDRIHLAAADSGEVVVVGVLSNSTDFGAGVLHPNGENIFVARLAQ